MLGTAGEELARETMARKFTIDLRERFENDYGKFRNELFSIPTKEGKWDSYTTNRPSTDAGKTINILSSAKVRIWIPLTDEDEKQRDNLSKTERFPYGVIALRDSIFMTVPEVLPLQSSLAWFPVVRGWEVVRAYLWEQDDGKNGKVVPDIAVWDILNTSWIPGTRGPLWVCYQRYASPEDIKDQYGEDLKPDSKGRILIKDVWDRDQFGVIGINNKEDGSESDNDWLKKPQDHNLGHVPVLILPNGSTPYIQSGRHDDTIKDVGESWAQHNRHLWDTESRMGSYILTMAGRAAKTPIKLYYDSTKGGKPIEFEGASPFDKGSYANINVGVGQEMKEGITPEMTRDAYEFFSYLQGREAIGGQTPIAFGQINQALPAAGINILRHASLDNIKPPQQTIETTYKWLAHELVSQYKTGQFEKMEIQGQDGSGRLFKMEVKPDDIDPSWNFEAKLLPDMPQDELANMGMAVQAVESALLSHQTARDKYNLVDDTDLEQHNIDKEKAEGIAGIMLRRVAAALRKDNKDSVGADFIEEELERERAEQVESKGVASQPGSKTPVRPSGTTTAATAAPPESPNSRPSAMRRFLSRFGAGGE